MKKILVTTIFLSTVFPCVAQPSRHAVGLNAVYNIAGHGAGIQYEWMLDRVHHLSLRTAIAVCFDEYLAHAPYQGKRRRPMMTMVETGFRIYPSKRDRVVKYGIGGDLIYGTGKGVSGQFVNGENVFVERIAMAIALSNSVNVRLGKHVRTYLAISLGLGGDSHAGVSGPTPYYGFTLGAAYHLGR